MYKKKLPQLLLISAGSALDTSRSFFLYMTVSKQDSQTKLWKYHGENAIIFLTLFFEKRILTQGLLVRDSKAHDGKPEIFSSLSRRHHFPQYLLDFAVSRLGCHTCVCGGDIFFNAVNTKISKRSGKMVTSTQKAN